MPPSDTHSHRPASDGPSRTARRPRGGERQARGASPARASHQAIGRGRHRRAVLRAVPRGLRAARLRARSRALGGVQKQQHRRHQLDSRHLLDERRRGAESVPRRRPAATQEAAEQSRRRQRIRQQPIQRRRIEQRRQRGKRRIEQLGERRDDLAVVMGVAEVSERFDCFGSSCAAFVTGPGREGSGAGGRRAGAPPAGGLARALLALSRPDSELSRLNADPRWEVPVSLLMARLAQAVRVAATLTERPGRRDAGRSDRAGRLRRRSGRPRSAVHGAGARAAAQTGVRRPPVAVAGASR